MEKQGHGNHWECVANLVDVPQKILSKLVREVDIVEKADVFADCFYEGEPALHKVFSISNNSNLSALALIVENKKNNANEIVTAYPIAKNGEKVQLKIVEIKEYQNGVEAIIESETKSGQTISFFDTMYFKNKTKYTIGQIYTFAISALAYHTEALTLKSFILKGQQAIDWLAKIGKEPDYDDKGNVKPIEFDLTQLIAFLPRIDYPDDAEFQSPIYKIGTRSFYGTQLYKLKVCILRDPDVFINLYAKKEFFNTELKEKDAIRGLLWLQGYLAEEFESKKGKQKKTSNSTLFVDANGEPEIIKHDCKPERVGKEMTREERHRFAVELLAKLYKKSGMIVVDINHNYHREYPNLVMQSKNGNLYYVIIETACFPKRAESITLADFSEMKQYAKEFNATPTFAGMSFLNINCDMNECKMICGDSYIVSFKGLVTI